MKCVNIKVSIALWPRKKKTSLINIPLCPTTHGFFSDKQKSDARWAEIHEWSPIQKLCAFLPRSNTLAQEEILIMD